MEAFRNLLFFGTNWVHRHFVAVMKALHLSICIYRYVYQSQKAIIIYKGAKLGGAGGSVTNFDLSNANAPTT